MRRMVAVYDYDPQELSPNVDAEVSIVLYITSNGLAISPTGVVPMAGEVVMRRMVAVYDYDPQELSPNVDAEVSYSNIYH